MLNSSVLRKGLQTVAAGMSPQVAQNLAQERANQANFEQNLSSGLLEQQIAMAQQMADDDPRKMEIVSGIIQQLEPIAPTVAEGLKRSLPSVPTGVPTGINPQAQPQLDAASFGAFGESQKARETRVEQVRLERQREAVRTRIKNTVKDPEEQQFLTDLADTSDNPAEVLKLAKEGRDMTRFSAFSPSTGQRFTAFSDKEGNVFQFTGQGLIPAPGDTFAVSTQVTGGSEVIGGETLETKAKRDEARQEVDFVGNMRQQLAGILEAVEKDPSLVGAPGAIRRAGQTITGSIDDISSLLGPNMDPTINQARTMLNTEDFDLSAEQRVKLFNDPNLSKLRLFENSLGLALARLRHPSGRVPVDIIQRSINDAKLTGFTSSQDVINRLREIDSELANRAESSQRALGRSASPSAAPSAAPATGKVLRFDAQGNLLGAENGQ